MIYLIIGQNDYQIDCEIAKIHKDIDVDIEKIDIETLTVNGLADIVRGCSLFCDKRLILLKQLSDNKELWNKLGEWIDKISEDTTLILVETKPDKRTKAFKNISKKAKIITADSFSARDSAKAEKWLQDYAADNSVKIGSKQAYDMVSRATILTDRQSIIDQYLLVRAVQSLKLIDNITDDDIAAVMPLTTSDVLFSLLSFAVNRESEKVENALQDLKRTQDPYAVLALMMSQWSNLVMINISNKPSNIVASELGIHPFVAKQLSSISQKIDSHDISRLTKLCADIDIGVKNSQFTPWGGVEYFLINVITR